MRWGTLNKHVFVQKRKRIDVSFKYYLVIKYFTTFSHVYFMYLKQVSHIPAFERVYISRFLSETKNYPTNSFLKSESVLWTGIEPFINFVPRDFIYLMKQSIL